ncbi:hypothetical protein DPSP01_003658 [Paraphaeosphaeria sporulosa]
MGSRCSAWVTQRAAAFSGQSEGIAARLDAAAISRDGPTNAPLHPRSKPASAMQQLQIEHWAGVGGLAESYLIGYTASRLQGGCVCAPGALASRNFPRAPASSYACLEV